MKSDLKRRGPIRRARVVETQRLTVQMVRITFEGDDLREIGPLVHTDAYVKIRFGEQTRTYTVRHHDQQAARMVVDFVVHGDEGLAGPWAAAARPGEEISFGGPGGGWAPDPEADHHVLAGDESALPAIAAALDALPHGARATVLAEVADEHCQPPLRLLPGVDVRWIRRDQHPGVSHGIALAEAVCALPLPEGRVAWFVHGTAEMVKQVRRHLFVELDVPRQQASISGYWRTGMTEADWQASKRDFVASMEQAEREELGAQPA